MLRVTRTASKKGLVERVMKNGVLQQQHEEKKGMTIEAFNELIAADGEEFDLTDSLVGLKVSQQIEITPPTGTTYSSNLVEE